MSLPRDWKGFLQLLNSRGAEYVVVGAFALAFHCEPRFTAISISSIHRTPENANRIIEALHEFGFARSVSLAMICYWRGNVIQLGIQPNRIDLLNFLTGVDAEVVWRNRISGDLDGVPLAYIDLESFKVNKLAAGRDKDLEDLRRLGKKS